MVRQIHSRRSGGNSSFGANQAKGKGNNHVCCSSYETGRLANAKPCANCVEVMRMMGIKKVAWTTARQTIEIASIDEVDTEYIPHHSAQASSYTGLECVMERGD